MLLLFLTSAAGAAFAQSPEIYLGSADGLPPDGIPLYDGSVTFHIYYCNDYSYSASEICNGFELSATGGVTWVATYDQEFSFNPDDPNIGFTSFGVYAFSWDGSGADTVGIEGTSLWHYVGRGLRGGYNGPALWISVDIDDDPSFVGETFCIDSCLVPPVPYWPVGWWHWVVDSYPDVDTIFPAWGGPYCFQICDQSDQDYQPLGQGTNDRVRALENYGGMLVAGGDFTQVDDSTMIGIASWDGSGWSSMGSISGDVYTLSEYMGKPVAGGWFALADGVPVNYIAERGNGGWAPLGSGVNNHVSALTVFGSDLIAGGAFTSAGGSTAYGVARWNGSTWQTMGGLLINDVSALTEYNGELIAGGRFQYNLYGELIGCIARWNGTKWVSLGPRTEEGEVWTLAAYDGDLIAGGLFSVAGGVGASNIARWDGSSWHALGAGVDDTVLALLVTDSGLIVGGDFDNAGGQPASKMARWDGWSWHPLCDAGLDRRVRALAVYQGSLVLGGDFTGAGCAVRRRIASLTLFGCCVHRGDVDHGGGSTPIDISDLVYIVDYMFNSGPEPICFDEGDIDGSGTQPIDISDLVYLVDYMFTGGPLPPGCP